MSIIWLVTYSLPLSYLLPSPPPAFVIVAGARGARRDERRGSRLAHGSLYVMSVILVIRPIYNLPRLNIDIGQHRSTFDVSLDDH
eukprot:scaffold14853_cov154-Skeletonema_menzelii.AAC.2